jgi:hypothetical protein
MLNVGWNLHIKRNLTPQEIILFKYAMKIKITKKAEKIDCWSHSLVPTHSSQTQRKCLLFHRETWRHSRCH